MSNPSPEIELLAGQKQNGESKKAIQACNDWLRLGAGRTLPTLLSKYTDSHRTTPPTKSLDTLKHWSTDYGWAERASEYDVQWEAHKNAERQQVMNEGLALDYERVRKLLRLATFLEDQIYEKGEDDVYHNVWLPDVKGIGSKETFERVDIERFNGALIQQYRETLEDIAQEVGGRVQKQDLTSGGQPISVTFNPIPARDKPPT